MQTLLFLWFLWGQDEAGPLAHVLVYACLCISVLTWIRMSRLIPFTAALGFHNPEGQSD
jgi:hypothetical protein